MNNRDMFYNSYGYAQEIPKPQMYMPNMMMLPFQNQTQTINNNLENRLNQIEDNIEKLHKRLTKLESLNNSNNVYNEPDNNLYML